MAKLVKTSGEITDVYPSKGKKFTLEELQAYVEGWIEMLKTNDPKVVLVVNEEGKLNNMPLNPTASKMLGDKYGGQSLVGDVLICASVEID